MKKLILFAILLLISCKENSNTQDDIKLEIKKEESSKNLSKDNIEISLDKKWKIRKEEPNKNLSKDNIEISLDKKVDEKVLKEIALEIRKNRMEYNKLWIFYYIPNMTDGMAWATTHFTPDLEIKIIGSTENEDQTTSKISDIDGEILNKWRSEKSLMGATLILFKNSSNKKIMRIKFKDGSTMDSEITESELNGKVKYQDNNEIEEYFILESNGNLGLYSKNGKFDEAVKIE